MHDKFKAVLVSLVVAFAAVFGVATPARAADYDDCNNAYICLWTNAYYGGTIFEWTVGYIKTLPGDCLELPAVANNVVSSIRNRSGLVGGEKIVFFDLVGGGANFARSTIFEDSNLGDSSGVPAGFNNKISSICIM